MAATAPRLRHNVPLEATLSNILFELRLQFYFSIFVLESRSWRETPPHYQAKNIRSIWRNSHGARSIRSSSRPWPASIAPVQEHHRWTPDGDDRCASPG